MIRTLLLSTLALTATALKDRQRRVVHRYTGLWLLSASRRSRSLNFAKYSQIGTQGGITRAEVARQLLRR